MKDLREISFFRRSQKRFGSWDVSDNFHLNKNRKIRLNDGKRCKDAKNFDLFKN
jgi:hypothetical protein